jgi:hypothetical protein
MTDTALSFESIGRSDLRRLSRLARTDRDEFFERHPEWGESYRDRVLCVALCDQAALHFIGGRAGLRDFQVWTFYLEHPDGPFPHQVTGLADFGPSQFGRPPDAAETFKGRQVHLYSRSLPCQPGAEPVAVLQDFLRAGETRSARTLREGAVVLLEPEVMLGFVAWPSLV